MCEWHFGEIASCHALKDEAVALAKELKDMNAVPLALHWAAVLGVYERNPARVGQEAVDSDSLLSKEGKFSL